VQALQPSKSMVQFTVTVVNKDKRDPTTMDYNDVMARARLRTATTEIAYKACKKETKQAKNAKQLKTAATKCQKKLAKMAKKESKSRKTKIKQAKKANQSREAAIKVSNKLEKRVKLLAEQLVNKKSQNHPLLVLPRKRAKIIEQFLYVLFLVASMRKT
jgi:hypothetical protein